MLLVLGSAAIAVSEHWIAKARTSRGPSKWGLVRPPLGAVALRAVGVGAALGAVIWNVDQVVWAFVALVAAWLPALVVAFVHQRRTRQAADVPETD